MMMASYFIAGLFLIISGVYAEVYVRLSLAFVPYSPL